MKQYNIRELRAGLREALNEAESGETVLVTRHDVDFVLVSKKVWHDTQVSAMHGVSSLITDEVSSDIRPAFTEVGFIEKKDLAKINIPGEAVTLLSTPPEKYNSFADAIRPSALRAERKYCKNGHIRSSSGKCLQKGCKYA